LDELRDFHQEIIRAFMKTLPAIGVGNMAPACRRLTHYQDLWLGGVVPDPVTVSVTRMVLHCQARTPEMVAPKSLRWLAIGLLDAS
jgi:hypothetical protein